MKATFILKTKSSSAIGLVPNNILAGSRESRGCLSALGPVVRHLGLDTHVVVGHRVLHRGHRAEGVLLRGCFSSRYDCLLLISHRHFQIKYK